jgi:hypothetical protein
MSALEEILAFLFVMGIVSIPIVAILTRKNSAIGQAWADRIRLRSERRHGRLLAATRATIDTSRAHGPASTGGHDRAADQEWGKQQEIIDAQQAEIKELYEKVEFLQRLIEDGQKGNTSSR